MTIEDAKIFVENRVKTLWPNSEPGPWNSSPEDHICFFLIHRSDIQYVVGHICTPENGAYGACYYHIFSQFEYSNFSS